MTVYFARDKTPDLTLLYKLLCWRSISYALELLENAEEILVGPGQMVNPWLSEAATDMTMYVVPND